MKNISIKKGWMTGVTLPNVDPQLIPFIEETYDGKSDKDSVKLKLGRDLTLSTLDFYELKMSLFDNGEPEEFILFVRTFNMTLTASGTLEICTKIKYLCNLVCGEAFNHFDFFSANTESTKTLNFEDIIKGLAQYFPPVNALSKKSASCAVEWKNYALEL